MLEFMRKSSNSIVMYFVFAGLAVVFAFSFGPGSGGFGQADFDEYAAKVDGEAIPAMRFRVALKRQRDAITQRFAGASPGFDTSFLTKGLEQRVIDQMISQVLLRREAEKLGLVVSDDELAEFMAANIFTSDGVTPEVYRDWVRRSQATSPESFENELRSQILGDKIQTVIEANLWASDEELEKAFLLENNRLKVTFVRFDPKKANASRAPDDTEIDQVIQEQRAVLEERYNRDIFRYRNPERRRFRQILKKAPEDADDVKVAELRAQLVALKTQLEGGADFAALAKRESQADSGKESGGDMGFVKRGALAPALDNAVFGLSQGTMSDPVETEQGVHLVEVVEIEPASNKPLEDVIREIARAHVEDEQKRASARDSANTLLAQLKAGRALDKLTVSEAEKRESSEELKDALVRVTSPWILKTQDSIPRVGKVDGLVDELFKMKTNAPLVDRVVESNDAFFVLRLEERETPNLDNFAEKKDALRETELSKRKTRVVNDWIEHLRSKATILYNPKFFEAKAGA